MDEKKTSYPGISAEGYRQNTELSRCIFQIFLKYIKLFQKYSLYWFYAVLIFTSKLRGPLQQNYPSPQQYNPPPPTKIKTSDPLAKTFLKFLTPPPPKQEGGACPEKKSLSNKNIITIMINSLWLVKLFYKRTNRGSYCWAYSNSFLDTTDKISSYCL